MFFYQKFVTDVVSERFFTEPFPLIILQIVRIYLTSKLSEKLILFKGTHLSPRLGFVATRSFRTTDNKYFTISFDNTMLKGVRFRFSAVFRVSESR